MVDGGKIQGGMYARGRDRGGLGEGSKTKGGMHIRGGGVGEDRERGAREGNTPKQINHSTGKSEVHNRRTSRIGTDQSQNTHIETDLSEMTRKPKPTNHRKKDNRKRPITEPVSRNRLTTRHIQQKPTNHTARRQQVPTNHRTLKSRNRRITEHKK